MSKQYLITHTIDYAHKAEIYSLAVTPTSILSVSGTSSLKICSTLTSPPTITQTIPAHKLGSHHICTSKNGFYAASAGFDGTICLWKSSFATKDADALGKLQAGGEEVKEEWSLVGNVTDGNTGQIWALSLDSEGRFLAGTTADGKIIVWDLGGQTEEGKGVGTKIKEYETKGSFGLCVDISADGRYTASGHENGEVYIFNNDTGRMMYSLPGLVLPIRTLSFSPLSTYLAYAGDSRTITLYSITHGEQISTFTGHRTLIFSLDWNFTGEYIVSGGWDGKLKVWSVETRSCVATHNDTDVVLWCVKWLPKVAGRSEQFVAAGGEWSLTFYREATGG